MLVLILSSHVHTMHLFPILESNAYYHFNLNPPDNIPSSANDCLHGPSGHCEDREQRRKNGREENGVTDEETL